MSKNEKRRLLYTTIERIKSLDSDTQLSIKDDYNNTLVINRESKAKYSYETHEPCTYLDKPDSPVIGLPSIIYLIGQAVINWTNPKIKETDKNESNN